MIELLQKELEVEDLEAIAPQIDALDRELEIAVKNQNADLEYWKWQYAALRNLKTRAELAARDSKQVETKSLQSLMREG